LNFLVNTNLASRLGNGPLTAINTAFMLMMMIEIVVAQSIAIAAFPTFSAQVANGKLADMRSSLASLLRGLLFLSIPASLGLIILRVPLITLLYQGGRFDATSTQYVSWALLSYTIGLAGFCVVEIVSRAFYALHDTKTPVFVGIITMSINIGLSFVFLKLFPLWGWLPHGGLALSMTLASYIEMAVLLIVMRRKLSGLEGGKLFNGVAKALLAGGLMALALWGWLTLTVSSSIWIVALGGIAVGILAYIIGLIVLRVPEMKMVFQLASKLMARFGGRKAGSA
jgi:putative peptidoglycan lipid II flippase